MLLQTDVCDFDCLFCSMVFHIVCFFSLNGWVFCNAFFINTLFVVTCTPQTPKTPTNPRTPDSMNGNGTQARAIRYESHYDVINHNRKAGVPEPPPQRPVVIERPPSPVQAAGQAKYNFLLVPSFFAFWCLPFAFWRLIFSLWCLLFVFCICRWWFGGGFSGSCGSN